MAEAHKNNRRCALLQIDSKDVRQVVALQAAAVAVGYSGAALPLWQEFLVRFISLQTELQGVVPTTAVRQHLAQLGQLYEAQSPLLGEIYMLIAPLSPDSLPGEPSSTNPPYVFTTIATLTQY